jgi:hypothetical protein
MKNSSLTAALKYGAAFITGYVGALLPVLATGDPPSQKALVAAFAPALLATGLFHAPGPLLGRSPHDSSND